MANNKKTYITPKALFINLEEETSLLAGSVTVVDEETGEGVSEKYSIGLMETDYTDLTSGGNSPIWN